MINEVALKDALLALAQQSKTHYIAFSSVLNEVAALRETVRGLDPTFSEVLETKRLESAQAQAEIVKITIRLHDEIIGRLKAGEVC